MNYREYVAFQGYKSFQAACDINPVWCETMQAACEVELAGKEGMFEWLIGHGACVSGLAWAICNADTLEQLWDRLMEARHTNWLLWVADRRNLVHYYMGLWHYEDKQYTRAEMCDLICTWPNPWRSE